MLLAIRLEKFTAVFLPGYHVIPYAVSLILRNCKINLTINAVRLFRLFQLYKANFPKIISSINLNLSFFQSRSSSIMN